MAFNFPLSADSIRLHEQAGSAGPTVTLAEVAELEGAYAESLGGVVVGAFREGAPQLRITFDTVQALLTREQANWAKLALRGHDLCRVHRTTAEPALDAHADSPVVANVESEIGLGTAMSLRDLLIERIVQVTGVDRADLRVTISPRGEGRLRRSAYAGRYELEPATSAKFGRLVFTIRRYEGPAVAETFTATADVAQRAVGLVATRTINRGETFAADAMELRELWLDDGHSRPLADAAMVTGQAASKLLRKGTVIYPEHVESPVLVRRGELVTVRCLSGGLVIRTVARARENGAMDDVIRVTNEKTREVFRITVTGDREGAVIIAPEGPEGAES